jgi:hypothetical protein
MTIVFMRKQKGFTAIEAIFIAIALIVIGLIVGLVYPHYSEDNSIYSKLSTDSFTNTTSNISFEYPSFMEKDKALEKSYSAAYVSTPQKMLFVVVTVNVSPILKALNMSPTQYMTAAQEHSTSFTKKLNSISNASSNIYDSLFGGCLTSRKLIKTTNGQTALVCVTSIKSPDVTQVQIMGVTSNYTVKFALNMPTTTWNEHPKVWEKVEKSLSYQ